jgi:hypothetical protein
MMPLIAGVQVANVIVHDDAPDRWGPRGRREAVQPLADTQAEDRMTRERVLAARMQRAREQQLGIVQSARAADAKAEAAEQDVLRHKFELRARYLEQVALHCSQESPRHGR